MVLLPGGRALAGAQAEAHLEIPYRLLEGVCVGERAEVEAVVVLPQAVEEEVRKFLSGVHSHQEIPLVVPQIHIVSRVVLLDELGFEQERLRLRVDGEDVV